MEKQSVDINENCEKLTKDVVEAADVAIPQNSAYVRGEVKVPWWTEACRNALTKRNRTFRQYKTHKTKDSWISYKQAQAEARRIIKEAKRKSWRDFISRINRNTTVSDVWNTIRAISGKKSKAGVRYLRINGRMVMNPRLIANTIGDRISYNSSSVNCSREFKNRKNTLEKTSPNFSTVNSHNLDYNKPFSLHELETALKKVKGTSAGPDLIRYEMIKNLGKASKLTLFEYFNDIWQKHEFPKQWQMATIIPILKPGKDRFSPDSYRPIALTNCFCKVLERLVNNRLLYILEQKRIICPFQSGFRKGRCTYDNLTRIERDIHAAFSEESSVLAVFLDIQKAYDMAWRRGILEKLYEMGFRGHLPIL